MKSTLVSGAISLVMLIGAACLFPLGVNKMAIEHINRIQKATPVISESEPETNNIFKNW